MTHAVRQESPSRLSAAVNARHLEEVPERDLGHLADQIEDAVSAYLTAAASADDSTPISTPNGLAVDPPTMTALLLGEQVVHGLDIARAAKRSVAGRITRRAVDRARRAVRRTAISAPVRGRCAGELRVAHQGCEPLPVGSRPRNRRRHRCGRKVGLCDHRGPRRVPSARVRTHLPVVADHARQASRRRQKAMVGNEVRHIVGESLSWGSPVQWAR